MTDPAITEHIEHCWARGDSVKDARISVSIRFGVDVSFKQVHGVFVRLSHGLPAEARAA